MVVSLDTKKWRQQQPSKQIPTTYYVPRSCTSNLLSKQARPRREAKHDLSVLTCHRRARRRSTSSSSNNILSIVELFMTMATLQNREVPLLHAFT